MYEMRNKNTKIILLEPYMKYYDSDFFSMLKHRYHIS